jgi:hypothetical protein
MKTKFNMYLRRSTGQQATVDPSYLQEDFHLLKKMKAHNMYNKTPTAIIREHSNNLICQLKNTSKKKYNYVNEKKNVV